MVKCALKKFCLILSHVVKIAVSLDVFKRQYTLESNVVSSCDFSKMDIEMDNISAVSSNSRESIKNEVNFVSEKATEVDQDDLESESDSENSQNENASESSESSGYPDFEDFEDWDNMNMDLRRNLMMR
jgi:hypothetical protein